jgi:hypothetical protein
VTYSYSIVTTINIMSRANLSNPLTIMHILANHHPPPTPSILADLPNPDPANGVQVQNQPLTAFENKQTHAENKNNIRTKFAG